MSVFSPKHSNRGFPHNHVFRRLWCNCSPASGSVKLPHLPSFSSCFHLFYFVFTFAFISRKIQSSLCMWLSSPITFDSTEEGTNDLQIHIRTNPRLNLRFWTRQQEIHNNPMTLLLKHQSTSISIHQLALVLDLHQIHYRFLLTGFR